MDEFEKTIAEVQKALDEPQFHVIKDGEQEIKLFKSLVNHRLSNETFGEYKVRQKINQKMIKKFKQNGYPQGNVPV